MSQPTFNAYGAVDLSTLAQRSTAGPGAGPGAGTPAASDGLVVEVTEETFQAEVLERSLTVPVVIDFWADWCGPCKQLSPILERLAAEYGGRFVLAKIDVDANQQLAAAAQIQSIPTVLGVVRGQALPLFMGALPEPQVRLYVDELLKAAATGGVTGQVEPGEGPAGPTEPGEPPHDPRYDAAYDAIERGDLEAAAAAYEALIQEFPADQDARAGRAQVDLLRRTTGLDPGTARTAAAEHPDDVDAQLALADLEFVDGRVEEAFARLVGVVGRTSGEDRERARTRLLELFGVIGEDDPRVARARGDLASALF